MAEKIKENLVNKKAFKEVAKENRIKISGSCWDLLNEATKEMLVKACKRAELNGRHTLKERDI